MLLAMCLLLKASMFYCYVSCWSAHACKNVSNASLAFLQRSGTNLSGFRWQNRTNKCNSNDDIKLRKEKAPCSCARGPAAFRKLFCLLRGCFVLCCAGHSGIDCSKCAMGFSSTSRNSERGHDCYPCPGKTGGGACSHRGVCVDDHYVQAAAEGRDEVSDPRLLRGNGSCVCHPNYFGKAWLQSVQILPKTLHPLGLVVIS